MQQKYAWSAGFNPLQRALLRRRRVRLEASSG